LQGLADASWDGSTAESHGEQGRERELQGPSRSRPVLLRGMWLALPARCPHKNHRAPRPRMATCPVFQLRCPSGPTSRRDLGPSSLSPGIWSHSYQARGAQIH